MHPVCDMITFFYKNVEKNSSLFAHWVTVFNIVSNPLPLTSHAVKYRRTAPIKYRRLNLNKNKRKTNYVKKSFAVIQSQAAVSRMEQHIFSA